MAYAFNYEWYTIDVQESTGRITWEVKARNKDNAIKTIKRLVTKKNKDAHDMTLPWWKRGGEVKEVLWDTLNLDRIGHNR